MATILTMRFNEKQAAIVSDESTWHTGVFYDYRRTNYGEFIYPLMNKEGEDGHKISAIYAGVGFPAFHKEISDIAKKEFELMMKNGECSRLNMQKNIYKIFDKVHKRYVNDRLNFHYGIDLDNLNSGSFTRNKKSYELKQTSVKKEARKVVGYGDRGDAMQRIFENSGLFVSYDEKSGIDGTVIAPGYNGTAFSSIITVVGHGSRVSNVAVNKNIVEKMNLTQRREGFSMEEGLYKLLNISSQTFEMTNKMGGYFQIVIIDMSKEKIEDRVVEICDHRSRLTHEIMKAVIYGFLDEKRAMELNSKLLLKGETFEKINEELMNSVTEKEKFKLRLQGYKMFKNDSADDNFKEEAKNDNN